MTKASEEQVAALQERIRLAGDRIPDRLNKLSWVVTPLWFGAIILFVRALPPFVGLSLLLAVTFFCCRRPVTVWLALAGPFILAECCLRLLEARPLRARLLALPLGERARVLLPLRADSAGWSWFVTEMLIYQTGIEQSEVSPSAAPTARGDEAGAAE